MLYNVGFCVAVRLRLGNARSLDQKDGNRYRFLRFFRKTTKRRREDDRGINEFMTYTLTFTCHGKSYLNAQTGPGRCLPNQYEAVALGLLLGEIDSKGLSRDDAYNGLCLREQGIMEGKEVDNVVWTAKRYIPISEEVK